MDKRGILLMNLGSPDSTAVPDVRKYLNEFLMDERVIDKSYLFRLLLVKGIITPFRAPKSAKAYSSIWTKDGSPLVHTTHLLQQALQAQVSEPVEIAMRYGTPSVTDGFNKLMQREPNLTEVVAVALYPHYAMSSYETAVVHAQEMHKHGNFPFKLKFVPVFYDNDAYISAMAENIAPHLQQDYDHILFSYHGVPGRHVCKTDITHNHCLKVDNCCEVASPAHAYCYRHQCFTTTKLITEKLNIPAHKFSISFQSRLGKGWLQPFTDKRLEEMPKEGIKKLLILCPAFVSDCLETLEEIAEEGKEIFMHAGGEHYEMIPCMNTNHEWVNALKGLIEHELVLPLADVIAH